MEMIFWLSILVLLILFTSLQIKYFRSKVYPDQQTINMKLDKIKIYNQYTAAMAVEI